MHKRMEYILELAKHSTEITFTLDTMMLEEVDDIKYNCLKATDYLINDDELEYSSIIKGEDTVITIKMISPGSKCDGCVCRNLKCINLRNDDCKCSKTGEAVKFNHTPCDDFRLI